MWIITGVAKCYVRDVGFSVQYLPSDVRVAMHVNTALFCATWRAQRSFFTRRRTVGHWRFTCSPSAPAARAWSGRGLGFSYQSKPKDRNFMIVRADGYDASLSVDGKAPSTDSNVPLENRLDIVGRQVLDIAVAYSCLNRMHYMSNEDDFDIAVIVHSSYDLVPAQPLYQEVIDGMSIIGIVKVEVSNESW